MRIMANSVPKSGTNLLLRLLTLLGFEKNDWWVGPYLVAGKFSLVRQILRARGPKKVTIGIDTPVQISSGWLRRRIGTATPGSFFIAHCPYSPEMAGLLRAEQVRTVCMIRDPRDVAVSHMHYLKQNRLHPLHTAYTDLQSDHERLLFSIRGGELGQRNLQSLEQRYRRVLAWQRDEDAILVKFENLVGSKGGGSDAAQRDTVRRVAAHLNLELEDSTVESTCERLFGSSSTFRKGQIGGWEVELSCEHQEVVKEVAGPLLVELGYEKGPDW